MIPSLDNSEKENMMRHFYYRTGGAAAEEGEGRGGGRDGEGEPQIYQHKKETPKPSMLPDKKKAKQETEETDKESFKTEKSIIKSLRN